MDTVTWTDEKLDAVAEKVDLLDTRVGVVEKKVDSGFARAEVEYVRTDERFKAVGERFDEVNRRLGAVETNLKEGFAGVDAKFDALNRTLLQIGGGMIGTLIAGIVTLIALMLTH